MIRIHQNIKQGYLKILYNLFLLVMDNRAEMVENEIKAWTEMSDMYAKVDSAAQIFYNTLVHVMKLDESKNILEVGCGRCLFLPLASQLKPQQTPYMASDLTPKMLEHAQKYLKNHLAQFESKLSFEEWLKKNAITLKIANAEQPFNANPKFDRIICNMVLMMATDTEAMLKNFANQSEQGGLLGVSVWGDKTKEVVHSCLGRTLEELGIENPNKFDEWHLYQKVGAIGEKAGWEVVLNWEQQTVFPYLTLQDCLFYTKMAVEGMQFLSGEQKEKVTQLYHKKLQDSFTSKKPALFPVEMYVLRKK